MIILENGKQPAFPVDPVTQELGGLTKREYFAALFMQSMVAGEGARMIADRDGRYNETNWKEVVSMNAIEFADALLKQLES